MKKYQHYINGEWIDSTGNELIAVVNPATEEVIGKIAMGNSQDVDKAVAAEKADRNNSEKANQEKINEAIDTIELSRMEVSDL